MDLYCISLVPSEEGIRGVIVFQSPSKPEWYFKVSDYASLKKDCHR